MKKQAILFCLLLSTLTNLKAQLRPKDFIDMPIDFKDDISKLQPVTIPAVPCGTNYQWIPTENYIPVWMKDGKNNIEEDVSPLSVRRDLYTCERMIRNSNGFIENAFDPFQNSNFGTNVNPDGVLNSGCPEDFRKCNIGFVGVNNTQPTEQLDVIGNIKTSHHFIGKVAEIGKIMYDGAVKDASGNPTGQTTPFLFDAQEVNFSGNINANQITANSFITNSFQANAIDLNGDFKIKNAQGQNVFAVYQNGDVRARKTTVDLLPIPDYVFKKEYKLMGLKELEQYIETHQHLPNIKSEAEYKNEGAIDLGELNVKLLEKVEELTLYTIQQQKQIDELKKMVLELKK
jgi:hypothetical protein